MRAACNRREIVWTLLAVCLLTATPLRADEALIPAKANQPVKVGIDSESKRDGTLPRRSAANSSATRTKTGGLESGPGALRLLWPMLIVLGAIFGVAMMLKRWSPRSATTGQRGGIQVLARQYLSNKQSVCLVRLGKRVVCIGVTPERITTLTQIDEPEEVATLVAAVQRTSPTSFTSVFNRLAGREAGTLDEKEIESAGTSPIVRTVEAGRQVRSLLGRVQAMAEGRSSAEPA